MPSKENINSTHESLFEDISDLIRQIGKRLDQNEREEFRTHGISGITPQQFFILRILWFEDGRPLKLLAEAANCTRPTMTGVIDTMEKDKLVSRVRNGEDRRIWSVFLTKKGNELQKYRPPVCSNIFNDLKGFKVEKLQSLFNLLEELYKKLEGK